MGRMMDKIIVLEGIDLESLLRDDWRGNRSNYDDEIGDMEGFELQHAGAE